MNTEKGIPLILKDTEILGKSFRIYGTKENPLFKVKDIAEIIEYDTSSLNKLVSMVDDEEKVRKIVPTLGGDQEMWMVTEDGFYEIMMQSRKPIAKQFKKGVKTILKEIRLNGGYIATSEDDTDEEIMAKALVVAQATIKRKEERIKGLQAENDLQKKQIVFIQAENDTLKAKQNYMDIVLQCKATTSTTQIAQDYGLSAKALNAKLHEMGIQRKVSGQWILYSKYLKEGYVQSDTISITRSDGRPDVVLNSKWTQKGRLFLYNTLKSNGIIPLIER